MSVPASPYRSFALPPSPSRRMHSLRPRPAGIAHVTLGLLATVGLMMWAAWLAAAGVAISSGQPIAAAPEVQAPTPPGATAAFDQVWTASNGNTIVTGQPQVDTSDSALHPGASVIRVEVTLTNNGEQEWSPAVTTFGGTINRVPLPESNEGDWKYSTPIAPQTSVTLSKVFLGGGGQFTLAVNTPQGMALFTGQV